MHTRFARPQGRAIALVIPAKALESSSSFDECRASTPPAEERVTSFFARAKKKVTKKESTLRDAPGFTRG
jgi:hypothetical protein